ncbi:MAG: polysaccharide deacetylase family protein [Clostridia bacterium]|nr:polysaccharide deacetylase family protein [Clostridia bacterium]
MNDTKKPNKILTFSYDDGVLQDKRLIELFDRYGMKATFNLNSELLGKPHSLTIDGKQIAHDKIEPGDVRSVYAGHEVAAHTLTHPRLPTLPDEEVIRQVEQDRKKLSELCGYEVVGFAYPCGGENYDGRVSSLIREKTGIRYCRTIISSHSFDPQENLYEFKPSVYHNGEWDKLFSLGEEFLSLSTEERKVFYVWGHSYEFDIHDTWGRFEEFLKMMSGKDDILYATNREALLVP